MKKAVKAKKQKDIAGLVSLWRSSLGFVWKHKMTLAQIALLHSALVLLFAANQSDPGSRIFVAIFALVFSLAEIWLMRQLSAGEKPRVKTALYIGTAQLVPFTLLFSLFVIQLLPFAAGLWLYNVGVLGGVLVGMTEQLVMIGLWLVLALTSGYLLTATSIALYIVSLPEVMPLQAQATAKNLVRGHRLGILIRQLTLLAGIALVVFSLMIVIPETWQATYNITNALIALLLPFVHVFMYKLYRSLV